MAGYTIVIADDHVMFREGVKHIIEQSPEVCISGEANDGLELMDLLKKSPPDLVVLDISMPNLRGLEAIKEIKRGYPQVKILVLTMHKKKEFIRQALAGGADGYLLKEDAGGELIQAVQAIRKGGKYFSPLVASLMTSLVLEPAKAEILSIREREVLKLLAEGKKTEEIAAILYISPHTVRRHRANIMEKLEINNLADLLKYAISHHYLVDFS